MGACIEIHDDDEEALAVISAHWQAADDGGKERIEVNFDGMQGLFMSKCSC